MNEEQNTSTISSPEKQPQPIDPSLSSEKSTQEKKSNKWIFVSLATFLLIALVIAGFFSYQNYQLKKEAISKKDTVTPSLTPVPTEVPSPTPEIDLTVDWFTFTKENFCYSFKYPQEITFNDEDVIRLSSLGPTQKKDTEFYDGLSLTFSLPLGIGNLSLNDYVDGQIEEIENGGLAEIVNPKEAILINGINGYTYTVQGLGKFQNIFLQSPDKTCIVKITNSTVDPTDQGYQKTVDKIFSTFKFVD